MLQGLLESEVFSLNNNIENVKKYGASGFENTYYLGYRDIPELLKKYVRGSRAIDYGCGTGRSTRFLRECGFTTLGVDLSREMLEKALEDDQDHHYIAIENAKIPVLDSSYDLVFSCFVLLVVPTKKDLLAILNEAYRCLKEGGIFIIVTGSEYLYSYDWLSYNVDYPENEFPKSGKSMKIQLVDLGVDFINYYWTDADYTELFASAGFALLEKRFPLGTTLDNKGWVSEDQYPPYVVYVLQK